MFLLYSIEDTLVIPPDQLVNIKESAYQALLSRYFQKIIPSEGICVLLKEKSLRMTDMVVIHGSGSVQVHVEFDMVLFKPTEGMLC